MKPRFNKTITLVIFAAFSGYSSADEWTGQDKTKHLLAGAVIGASVTAATGKEEYGLAAGATVAALKEYYDSKHPATHTASVKDFAVTTLGAYVGAKVGGFIITPNRIVYTKTFN